jgi:transposase InsO family protein
VTSRFRFISAHRAAYGVKRLCRLLAVSRSGFYRWIAAEPTRVARAAAEDVLAAQITAVHAASGGTYGSPRVTAELRDQGVRVNRKRVERIMSQRAVVGRHLRRGKRTTIPGPGGTGGGGSARPRLHRDRTRPALVRRHHLPAGR